MSWGGARLRVSTVWFTRVWRRFTQMWAGRAASQSTCAQSSCDSVRGTECGVQSQTSLSGDRLPRRGGKQKWESCLQTWCVEGLSRPTGLLCYPLPLPYLWEIMRCPTPALGELGHNNPEACLGRIRFGRNFAFKWCFSLANWMVYNTQVPVLFSSLWYMVAEEGPRAHLSFGCPGETSSYIKWWARFGELE